MESDFLPIDYLANLSHEQLEKMRCALSDADFQAAVLNRRPSEVEQRGKTMETESYSAWWSRVRLPEMQAAFRQDYAETLASPRRNR